MSTPVDTLELLSSLTQGDREWVIAQLPPPMKSRLLSLTAPTPTPQPVSREAEAAAAPVPAASMEPELAPAAIVELLRTEPAWMAAALACLVAGSATEEQMQLWPQTVRHDLEAAQRAGIALTPSMSAALLRLARTRAGTNPPAATPPTRFEALVGRLRAARSRKRLSVRL